MLGDNRQQQHGCEQPLLAAEQHYETYHNNQHAGNGIASDNSLHAVNRLYHTVPESISAEIIEDIATHEP